MLNKFQRTYFEHYSKVFLGCFLSFKQNSKLKLSRFTRYFQSLTISKHEATNHYCSLHRWSIMVSVMLLLTHFDLGSQPLQTSSLELPFVHRPNWSLDILHPNETLMETQIVSHSIFPRGCVASEVSKSFLEPVVDLVQGQLSFRVVQNGLSDEGGVSEWGSDVTRLVVVAVPLNL